MAKTWGLFFASLLIVVATIGWMVGTAIDASRGDFTPEGSRASALAQASGLPTAEPSVSSATSTPAPSPSAGAPELIPVPTSLRIPAINVDTSIVPVGLDANDNMEIPEDIRVVGWYDLGVPPGSDTGSAVLVAHRDGVTQGRGVFYAIGSLRKGDRISVTRSDGTTLTYRVAARELLNKRNFTKAAPELFAIDGPHVLTLISCGGYYDKANGGYQANVIVTAVPATAH